MAPKPRIQPTIEDPFQAFIFGEPGIGKSVLIGTGHDDPRLQPGLIIDIDNSISKMKSVCQRVEIDDLMDGKYEVDPTRWTAVRAKSWQDVDDLTGFINDPYEPHNVFRTVVFDSLTRLNFISLRHVVDQAVKANSSRSKYRVEQGDYGVSRNMINLMVATLRDLDINIIYTGHAEVMVDELNKIAQIRPALDGKLSYEVPGILEHSYYMKMRNKQRMLMFQPDSVVRAKARDEWGRLGDELVNPTLPKILDLLWPEEEDK